MGQAKGGGLKRLVGLRLRELRESFSLSQDQMAARARRWGGLNWTRSALAKIERGERPITLEEFLILPIVYKNTRLAELLPAEGWVALNTQAAVKAELLRKWLAGGDPGKSLPRDTDLPELRKVAKQWHHLKVRDEIGETERRLAGKLKVTPEAVARKARQLWGRSLADERERRLWAQIAPTDWAEAEIAESSPRTSALRGHITRELRKELNQVFTREEER